MGSQTNNLGTTVFVLFIVGIVLTGIFFISDDIRTNDKLDINSEILLNNLNNDYNSNYNYTTYLSQEQSNLTNGSNFEGVDAYVRQYLEDKSEIENKKSTVEKILTFPSLLLVIFGVSNSSMLIGFNVLVYSFLSFMIGLQIFKAIYGEVD
jgi:hypothetical protein